MINDKYKNLIKNQLEYALQKSSFYRNKFSKHIFNYIDEFEELPFTTKNEILLDQKAYAPFGSNRCVAIDNIVRVHKTSGTTNKPVIIALTQNDINNIIEIGSTCFSECGLKSDDIVFHCLNYNMWAGGFTDHQSLEKTGATVVPFGVGNTSNLIEMMLLMKATAIHCTPSYLGRIEQILRDEYSMQPIDLHLRIGLLGAEPGLQNPHFRKAIEDKWGIKAMNANYGLSEVLSMIASECKYQEGLHYRAYDKLYLELVDKSNNLIQIEKGAIGEMVFTNLYKEAQPLIRYKSGDIIRVTDTECACGSRGFIFDVIGRADDMFVVRGLNIFVSNIESIIMQYLPRISSEYRVLVNKNDPIDTIRIQIEVSDENEEVRNLIKLELVNQLKKALQITCDIEILELNTLERNEGKTKKLLRILGGNNEETRLS